MLTKMMGLKECEIRRFGFTFFGCVPGRVFVREVQFPSVCAQEGVESGCEVYELNGRRVSSSGGGGFHNLGHFVRTLNEVRPLTISFLKVMRGGPRMVGDGAPMSSSIQLLDFN